jgi:hypothetical protein
MRRNSFGVQKNSHPSNVELLKTAFVQREGTKSAKKSLCALRSFALSHETKVNGMTFDVLCPQPKIFIRPAQAFPHIESGSMAVPSDSASSTASLGGG